MGHQKSEHSIVCSLVSFDGCLHYDCLIEASVCSFLFRVAERCSVQSHLKEVGNNNFRHYVPLLGPVSTPPVERFQTAYNALLRCWVVYGLGTKMPAFSNIPPKVGAEKCMQSDTVRSPPGHTIGDFENSRYRFQQTMKFRNFRKL